MFISSKTIFYRILLIQWYLQRTQNLRKITHNARDVKIQSCLQQHNISKSTPASTSHTGLLYKNTFRQYFTSISDNRFLGSCTPIIKSMKINSVSWLRLVNILAIFTSHLDIKRSNIYSAFCIPLTRLDIEKNSIDFDFLGTRYTIIYVCGFALYIQPYSRTSFRYVLNIF